MKFFKRLSLSLPLVFVSTLTLSYMPVAQAEQPPSALNCHQLKTQLNALADKMQRSFVADGGSANNSANVGEVIWGGLVGQQLKKSNSSGSIRAKQLKRAYSQKCST